MRPYQIVHLLAATAAIGIGTLAYFHYLSWWWLVLPLFLHQALLILGAIYIGWNFYLVSMHKADAVQAVALTFDDGPATETTAILDILKAEHVEAAFFCIGKHAQAHPELVKRWHEDGHVVGNHSFFHGFHFDWQSSRKMAQELEQTNEVIFKTLGKTPLLFRPPYGVTNPNLARAVRATGMCSIGWSLRSFDTKARDKDELLNRILGRLKGGDIILLHDSVSLTREILTDLIHGARQKGYTFVRVDKMLGIEAYA